MRFLFGLAVAAAASPLAAQTPSVAIDAAPVADRCESLPIGGTGSATGGNGVLTVAGPEGRRVLRLDGRPVQRLARDVASVTVRAACRSGASDYYLLGLSTAGACPLRYAVAEIGRARTARLSPRFGSCTEGATAAISANEMRIAMPAGPGSTTTVNYRYAGGRITAVAPPPPPVVIATAPTRRRGREPVRLAAWNAAPACAIIARDTALQAEPLTADALLAGFQRDWPYDWRSRGRLSDQPFSRTSLRAVVTDLACLAALPGGERLVTRAARPLFESRRHGDQAFEQLDEVARGAVVDPAIRAAARTFHAQMRYQVDMPRLR